MSSIRLTLSDLFSRQLELELPDSDGTGKRYVKLEHLTEVGGYLDYHAPIAELRPLAVKELQISGLEWRIPGGRVFFGTPATVAVLNVDGAFSFAGDAGIPLDGELFVSSLDTEVVTIELATRRISCDFRADRLVLVQNDRVGHAAFGAIDAKNLQTALGGFFVRLDGLQAQTSRASWEPDQTRYEAAAVTLRRLSTHNKQVELEADQLELPAGLDLGPEGLAVGELAIDQATLVLNDLTALLSPPDPPAPDPATPAPDPPVEPGDPEVPRLGLIDLRLLDQLDGQVDVDATVDATVPVIGHRRATHHFRVAVDDGTINFKKLERDLASLEDAVIDFEVRNGHLVLERDVPIIPWLQKPIVTWALNDVERGLARKKVVRLRTLFNYSIPNENGGERADGRTERSGGVTLRSLSCDGVDVALRLAEPPADRSLVGPLSRATLAGLTITGGFGHVAEGTSPAGELTIAAADLDFSVRDLDIGGLRFSAANIHVDAIESARLEFTGLRPGKLVATLHGVRLTGGTLRPPPPSTGEPVTETPDRSPD